MRTLNFRMAAVLLAVGVLGLSVTVSTEVRAQAPAVDPAATQILKRMTDYLKEDPTQSNDLADPIKRKSNRYWLHFLLTFW